MMTLWGMIVWVVALGVMGGVAIEYIRTRKKGVDFEMDDLLQSMGLEDGGYSKKKLKPYLDRIDQLEERIKVLERIATDKKHNLSDEIASL